MKKNDVFRWQYKSIDGRFEPYHCKARICILRQPENGDMYLEDTYWAGCENTVFSLLTAEKFLNLEFLGNLDDFELKTKHDAVYYYSQDIMDLTHPNSYGARIYIRKGAKKNLEKMRRVMQAHIDLYTHDADYAQREAQRLKDQLETLTEDSYVPGNERVYID